METKRTWIYCRAVHNEPDADVLAIQQRNLENYAKEHGFEIVGFSSDMGNGLMIDRPGLLEFRAAAESGDVDILLISEVSCLGRDTDKILQYGQTLCGLGISVHTADCGEVDLSLYAILIGMIDEMENCHIQVLDA